jgi:hypothetical protein
MGENKLVPVKSALSAVSTLLLACSVALSLNAFAPSALADEQDSETMKKAEGMAN